MIAKVKTSNHAGLSIGQEGEVVEAMGCGYAVHFKEVAYSELFGGATRTREATIYLAKNEVEIIHEPKTSK